jgi:hypothetical protein
VHKSLDLLDHLICGLQAKPVAKNLAFARRVPDSYRRFAPRIAEGRDSYYFNLGGYF